jgi:heme-degrading monooxygenase HmoA
MLLERAEISITEGSEKEFAAAMDARGVPILKSASGVKSVQFGRGVENPTKFLILVEWESLDAHTAFRNAPSYPEFRKVFGPYSKGGSMEHFEMQ